MAVTEHIRALHGLCKCPLCGSDAKVYVSAGKQWRICCSRCELSTPRTTKTEAVIRWFNLHMTLRGIMENKSR